MPISVFKKVGQTPLEAINDLRLNNKELEKERLSYAGRLDPLAEGLLLILVGSECDQGNREAFLKLNKEYELEILLGFSTDSFDVLGIPTLDNNIPKDLESMVKKLLPEYLGNKHNLTYPAFSSKTIDGVSLFDIAKSKDGIQVELPKTTGHILEIEFKGLKSINTLELKEHIHRVISLVKGDFRQEVILKSWDSLLLNCDAKQSWPIIRLSVKTESGVYMRSLADSISKRLGTLGLAFLINRTKIGDFNL